MTCLNYHPCSERWVLPDVVLAAACLLQGVPAGLQRRSPQGTSLRGKKRVPPIPETLFSQVMLGKNKVSLHFMFAVVTLRLQSVILLLGWDVKSVSDVFTSS